jgi:molybdopterin-binding protein
MKRVLECVLLLMFFADFSFAEDQCAACKCREYPVPRECVKCCGVATGSVRSVTKTELTVNTSERATLTFTITDKTVVEGTLEEGSNVTIVYNKQTNVAGLIRRGT